MSLAPEPISRRERNKQAKLDRITAAASELFSQYSIDDVTTQQIAERADIGTGTLFLYAKTKGELLLLVQNAHYSVALDRGRQAANTASTAVDAVLAIIEPIVECNRVHVDNGRTYLREMVFGDPHEPRHAEALSIVGHTQEAIADVVQRLQGSSAVDAAKLARVISAVMFLAMASASDPQVSTDDILGDIRAHIVAFLPSS